MAKKHVKVFTAFSGYDSQCIALDELKKEYPDKFDYELIGWSEIDPYAIKTHNIFFPQYADRNYGDISKVNWEDVDDFDLLTYSSPCFVASTKVITKNGEKRIDSIKVGDEVLTHTGSYKKVEKVMRTVYDGMLLSIQANAKMRVICTPSHPFYVHVTGTECEYKWVKAQELNSDDYELTYFYGNEMYWAILNSVKLVQNKDPHNYVYNLEVEDDHSYTANRFVVHNCTDFSLAGARAGGEEGSGTRSSLLWEVRRCIEAKKPKYLLLENVTGLVNGKFRPLFDKWCKTVEDYGYENFWSVLNAKNFGVPQNRDRVFLVSIRRDNADEVINYNFPNEYDTKPQIEDILEEGGTVDEKYYVNQEKVDEFVRDNEEMIINHIKSRNKF